MEISPKFKEFFAKYGVALEDEGEVEDSTDSEQDLSGFEEIDNLPLEPPSSSDDAETVRDLSGDSSASDVAVAM